jgi:hypothetical protein
MNFTKTIITAATLLLGTLIACGNVENPVSPEGFEYPSTPPAYTGLPKIRPVTKVFTQFAASGVTKFEENGKVFYNASRTAPIRMQGELGTVKTDQPEEVTLGTIIVSPPTEAAPYGFLRKVTSISKNADGSVIIETSEATLQEAIAGSNLKKEDLKTTKFKIPVEVVMIPKGDRVLSPYTSQNKNLKPQFNVDIVELPDSLCPIYNHSLIGNAKVSFRPCVKAKLWATIDIDIGWWWIFPYLSGFGAKLNGFASAGISTNLNTLSAESGITLDIPVNLDAGFTIGSWMAPPFVIWLGPIPLVLTPQINLGAELANINVSVRSEASTNISTSLTNFSFNLGTLTKPLEYGFYCGNTVNSGQWGCRGINNVAEKFSEFTNQVSTWNPTSYPLMALSTSELAFELGFKAKVKLSGGIALYGVLGMVGSIEPYIRPQIRIIASPTTSGIKTRINPRITLGVDGAINGFVNLLFLNAGFNIAKFNDVIPQTNIDIFNSCWTGNTPTQC